MYGSPVSLASLTWITVRVGKSFVRAAELPIQVEVKTNEEAYMGKRGDWIIMNSFGDILVCDEETFIRMFGEIV